MIEINAYSDMQEERSVHLEIIEMDIFSWCCEYVYRGNYSLGQESARNESIRLQEVDFEGPLAVVIPPFPTDNVSQAGLANIIDHVRVHLFASKYQWEPLRVLSSQNLRGLMLGLHLSSIRADELLRYAMEIARPHVLLEETLSS